MLLRTQCWLLLVVGITAASLAIPKTKAAQVFTDVSSSHPYSNAIEYLYAEGMVEGYPNGTFKPDIRINRASFTKIVIESQFDDDVIKGCWANPNELFPDISSGVWFHKYACIAKQSGIIHGYADGKFRPAQTVNFAEAMKIVVSAFGYQVESYSPWYLPYFEILESRGAIPYTIETFDQEITRGEMAEMMYLLMREGEPHIPYGAKMTEFDVAYGDHPKQKLDVFTDESYFSAPVLMIVHGGGYISGDKRSMHVFSDFFRNLGFIVVTPTYRLGSDGVQFPTPINDVACALAWTKQNISEYGGDGRNIIIMGHSAGAHAAALLSYNTERDWLEDCDYKENLDVLGFIGSSGAYDNDLLPRGRIRDFGPFLGKYDSSATWGVTEPINYVSKWDPPALLITGLNDCFVNKPYSSGQCSENTDAFATELESKDVPTTVIGVPGWGHNDIKNAFRMCEGSPNDEKCEYFEDVKSELRTFLFQTSQ